MQLLQADAQAERRLFEITALQGSERRCKACTGNMAQARATDALTSLSQLICRACKSLLPLDRFSRSQMAPLNDLARHCKDCVQHKSYGTMRQDRKRTEESKSLEDQIKKLKLAHRALERKRFDMDLRGSTRAEYEASLMEEEAALNALASSLKSRYPSAYERLSRTTQVRDPTGLGQESDRYLAQLKMKKQLKKASASPVTNGSTASPPTQAAAAGNATTTKKQAPAKRSTPKSVEKKAVPLKKPRTGTLRASTETAASEETKPTPALSKRAAIQAAKLSQWYTPPPSAAKETESPPPRRILTRGRKRIAEPEIICITDDDSPHDKRTRAA